MRLFQLLFLLFLSIPVIEIFLLIQVGSMIGAWYTIGIVLLTAFIGANLLRHQGIATLQKAQMTLGQGQVPAQHLVEGVILLLCGALLLTPGFFTDIIGFLCLLPQIREALALTILHRAAASVANGNAAFQYEANFGQQSSSQQTGTSNQGTTIDGEFEQEPDDKPSNRLP